MKRFSIIILFVSALVLAGDTYAQFAFNNKSQEQMAMRNLSSMPLTFTENRGQWHEKALFKATAGGATFWFCNDEIAYVFTRDTDELLEDDRLMLPDMPDMPDKFDKPRYKKESIVISARLIGANPDAEIIGENRLSHNNNYYYGNDQSKWRTDVPNYSSITYKDIYPGIDLKYHGNGQGMKYDFIVHPGADFSQIRIRYEGADDLAITPNGDLEAATSFGPIHENIPLVYQQIGNSKREVTGRYTILAPGVFGFAVDDYDPSQSLVIDPEIVYSTYLGGSLEDRANAIAVDDSGNAYITGRTLSTDFPIENPYQTDPVGWDVFITKLSPDGNSIVYSTFLGGRVHDEGYAIGVDRSGNAYVTGYTKSTNFPTFNPYQMYQSYKDVFVTKLSSGGNSLVYSTYLGGNHDEVGRDIAVDAGGCAYIIGDTGSNDFPTENPYQTNQSFSDAFITKLSPDGISLIYSTYLGGSYIEYGMGIAVDSSGYAYITGTTKSTDFPTLYPYDGSYNGGDWDVFVTKLNTAGNSLVYSTYLGGGSHDASSDITVDGSGFAYVTGYTESIDFPTLNPIQFYQYNYDVFVTRFSVSGIYLVYSTYLGGDGYEYGTGITTDAGGCAYVTGVTHSTDFPTANPISGGDTIHGTSDGFLSKLSPEGNSLFFGSYLGGGNSDYGSGIVADSNGAVYVTGGTASSDFPIVNACDSTYNGGEFDVYVIRIDAVTGINENISVLPRTYQLVQNYPNPFNASTTIKYDLPLTSEVTIDIYDILGRKIGTLVNDTQQAGYHQATWNAGDVSSGIYFYRIQAGDFTESKSMLLLK
ncbi:MAG: T9SS type A sorting domain-containing protein [candidate division Zixibacteria bacterium]|nr:T9SS type A sorting domain-containing protein [candidate division Zixibacteria bacterium]